MSQRNRRCNETLDGSADLLLQGHIFSPKPRSEDKGAAVIWAAICSDGLQKLMTPAVSKPGQT